MKHHISSRRGENSVEFHIEIPDWMRIKIRSFVTKSSIHSRWGQYDRAEFQHLQPIWKNEPHWLKVLKSDVTDGLIDWIDDNDPPNEDGESRMEYFAYGWCAGDPSDFVRLVLDAINDHAD